MLEAVSLDPAARLTLRAALALLVLSAAMHKLRDMAAFRTAVAGYALLPARWLTLAAGLVVSLELAVGSSLIIDGRTARPALAVAVLLGVYTGAITVNLRRGRRDIDCGCGGPVGRVPLGGGLVVRNVLLMGGALVAALPAAPRVLLWLDGVTVVGGVAALGLLYAAAETALANAVRLDRLAARRIHRARPSAAGGSQWSLR